MKYLKNIGYFIITVIVFAVLTALVTAFSALWAAAGTIIFVVMVFTLLFLLVKEGFEHFKSN